MLPKNNCVTVCLGQYVHKIDIRCKLQVENDRLSEKYVKDSFCLYNMWSVQYRIAEITDIEKNKFYEFLRQ